MHIVSYRGASQAGGVSRLIQAGFSEDDFGMWWHMNNLHLQARQGERVNAVHRISSRVVQGHYKYVNEFLWPLMHDRPDLVRFDKDSHEAFKALNLALAVHLSSHCKRLSNQVFINDYQFALLPSFLSHRQGIQLSHFWHIPWPRTCERFAVAQLKEVAQSLLSNARLGFHTEQYVDNFCNFVQVFLPEYKVKFGNEVVISGPTGRTELVVNPAGVDSHLWHHLSGKSEAVLNPYPYILSVDRADYSKGVSERIDGIREFFRMRSDLIGKIQFVFICQPTRVGLDAFDKYWQECQAKYAELDRDLATSQWSPIRWIDTPVGMEELACWYAQAKAMLVNPSVDGLNLTAKEFVAATRNKESNLILSNGAGAWQELKDYVITLRSNSPHSIATAICTAMEMNPGRSRINQMQLRRIVRKNSVEDWWNQMTISDADTLLPSVVSA